MNCVYLYIKLVGNDQETVVASLPILLNIILNLIMRKTI